jgi:hypothetical protein
MPDLITGLVAVAGIIVGWGLKTLTDAWSWRRQQVLDAYLELLAAVDDYGSQASRLWSSGITDRSQEWVELAEGIREELVRVDRAHGKLSLVAGSRGAAVGFELYIACEVMFRRAVALPPSAAAHYHAASLQMVKTYHDFVEEGRREMALRRWRDRLPGRRETRFEMMSRRLDDLNRTDPFPVETNPSAQSNAAGGPSVGHGA